MFNDPGTITSRSEGEGREGGIMSFSYVSLNWIDSDSEHFNQNLQYILKIMKILRRHVITLWSFNHILAHFNTFWFVCVNVILIGFINSPSKVNYVQCSQKVSFRPETGPEFPQKIRKILKFFGPVYPYKSFQKDLVCNDREKIFCLFPGGNLLVVSTV